MKKIKLLLGALLLSMGLVACGGGGSNPPEEPPVVNPDDGGNVDEGPKEGEMRVYFKAPSTWKRAYIWAWTDGVGNHTSDAWPGASMEKDETTGLFYYDYDTTKYKNCIFSNGSKQTADLKSPTSLDSDCYVWRMGCYNEDTTVEPNIIEYGYYIVGSGSLGNWDLSTGCGMTLDEEVTDAYAAYSATYTFSAGDTFKIRDESGSTWLGYTSGAYGDPISSGKIKEAASDQNFLVVTAGTYKISVRISTRAETSILFQNV
jgi:hypothetical protein